jgi:hypothetical protein
MDDRYEFRTELGGRVYMKFNRFHVFRRSWFVTYLLPLFFVAMGSVAYYDDSLESAIVFWVAAPLSPLLMLAVMYLTAKRHLKTNAMLKNMKNLYYRLDRNCLFNETNSPKLKTTMESDWDNVHRVYESNDSYYIYISNMQAFILPKEHLVTGSVDGLSLMLQELVGKKYKKRK